MRVVDRKKMTDEIISRVKSVPVGVDWRIIRIKRKAANAEKIAQREKAPKACSDYIHPQDYFELLCES